MNDSHRDAFLEEAAELLGGLEGSLLELEERPDDAEVVAGVFRALHTIKGSGAMFGFDEVAGFTHELETVFDRVRQGEARASAELVGVTLAARDHIGALLAAPAGGDPALGAAGQEILGRLRRAVPAGRPAGAESPEAEAGNAPAARPDPAPAGPPASYRVRFDPDPDILLSGTDPIPLLGELRDLGECSLIAHLDRVPELDVFDCERSYTHWDAILTTAAGENAVRDVFIFVEDRARLAVQRIAEPPAGERPRLGEILAARGDVAHDVVEQCLAERPLIGELLVEKKLLSRDRVDAAVLEQQHLEALHEKRGSSSAAATLRVPAARLDALVNVVGELVTVQARLSNCALVSGDAEIGFISEEVERLSEQLRESTMSLRMQPIGETFGRFRRLVRDLSKDLGKKVELVTEGDDTELDKSVIEQLQDPLVHLVRNAVDHGVEMPERRAAAGKAQLGRIRLSAAHQGAFVVIRVSDDGAGLDRAAIRARAVERGLIAAEAALSDREIDALILAPGFSTAQKVTEISGRGVGMDVVQRRLDELRGTLSVESRPGAGSSFTLEIPLTLAIIDGLLVEAGGDCFVVPLSKVSECIELDRHAHGDSRQRLVNVREELVPYVSLREHFALPGDAPRLEHVIIAETHGGKYGFVVDRVIGDHNTVIKKLGGIFRHVEEISGATILGDGKVALILDPDKLVAGLAREARPLRAPMPEALRLGR